MVIDRRMAALSRFSRLSVIAANTRATDERIEDAVRHAPRSTPNRGAIRTRPAAMIPRIGVASVQPRSGCR